MLKKLPFNVGDVGLIPGLGIKSHMPQSKDPSKPKIIKF